MNYLLLSPKANSLLTNISLKKLSSLTWVTVCIYKRKDNSDKIKRFLSSSQNPFFCNHVFVLFEESDQLESSSSIYNV